MTAPKFTPGPWVVDEYEGAQSASGELIMWFGGYGDAGCIVKDADRALIAAAPELYEALETARDYVATALHEERQKFVGYEHASDIASIEADLAAVDAALAKARGES